MRLYLHWAHTTAAANWSSIPQSLLPPISAAAAPWAAEKRQASALRWTSAETLMWLVRLIPPPLFRATLQPLEVWDSLTATWLSSTLRELSSSPRFSAERWVTCRKLWPWTAREFTLSARPSPSTFLESLRVLPNRHSAAPDLMATAMRLWRSSRVTVPPLHGRRISAGMISMLRLPWPWTLAGT